MAKTEIVQKASAQRTAPQQQNQRETVTPALNPMNGVMLARGIVQPSRLTSDAVMHLQRTAGNNAVAQLLGQSPRVQRAVVGMEGGEIGSGLESRIRQSQSGGSPMPDMVRSTLEPKLNADLSGVKVHTGRQSVQLNRELGAKAFTHGNHIFYGAGQSPTDMKLTTHEAVHVVQQGAAGKLKRKPDAESIQRKAAPQIARNGKRPTIQRFAYDDDPSTWAPVTRIKRSGEGAEGVYFVFKGTSMIVVKPLNDPGNVEYANDIVGRITGLDVPKTKVYPLTGTDPISALLTSTDIEGQKSEDELQQKLRGSRYWLVMSTVTGKSIQMLGKDNNQVQDAIDFITSQTALQDTGRIMVADAFLGNQDRLIGMRVNLGNFFYRADNDRAATIDNDAEVEKARFRRNGDLDLSTALVVYENLMDGAKRNMHINAFIAKFKQVQPGAAASVDDDNVRQWVGEGIDAALVDMKSMFDNEMNLVRSAKRYNTLYGNNKKRDYAMIKGSAQYMQARQSGTNEATAKRKLGKYVKYKALYNKMPKGLKWTAKIWNGGRGF